MRLLLLRAGLIVVDLTWGPLTIDLERFEPVDELLVYMCRSRPSYVAPTPSLTVTVQHYMPKTAILIKACAMEWRTLQAQVRHLASSLQAKAAFDTVAIVLDCRSKGFVRAYEQGCSVGFLKNLANSLVMQRLVHKIIDCTQPEHDEVNNLLLRWLGTNDDRNLRAQTHAQNGSPFYSTLKAFEVLASEGHDLVLQVIIVREN